MEKYTKPELEIIKFNNEDVINTSNPIDDPNKGIINTPFVPAV